MRQSSRRTGRENRPHRSARQTFRQTFGSQVVQASWPCQNSSVKVENQGYGHIHSKSGPCSSIQMEAGDGMSRSIEECNRRLLRARDAMDRTFAEPLRIRKLARIAKVSEAHFIRKFASTFGETPHRYLQRRRIERAMFLLRTSNRSITDICFETGFGSLGTFSRTFSDVVGESPTIFRQRGCLGAVPTCFLMAWTRPSSFGEA